MRIGKEAPVLTRSLLYVAVCGAQTRQLQGDLRIVTDLVQRAAQLVLLQSILFYLLERACLTGGVRRIVEVLIDMDQREMDARLVGARRSAVRRASRASV